MNVAFIPVRGGSKSIPFKNIKAMCGKPLVYWTIKAACNCEYIDIVYVATDSDQIKETVETFSESMGENFDKIHVIGRSEESASDIASTESAMLEFAEKYEFDNIALIQATSPMLTDIDLNGGFEEFFRDGVDSVFSCVRQRRFIWNEDEYDNALPLNYNIFKRPRRQEFPGYLMENGAFYITSKDDLLRSQNRISGNIKAYKMREETAFEIDDPSDWIIVESLMKQMRYAESDVPEIKMFLTDSDGCLTDGGMYYSEGGDELKKFNAKDGMGFALLHEQKIISGIITGEKAKLVKKRADKLNINELHMGVKDKLKVVTELSEKYNIPFANIAYVGDDINDIQVLRRVGYPCTVRNASSSIKKECKYVSALNGGEGAIRDIIETIISR